ncbi:MAG: LAGLIDADG family homing endonuclease [Candidatus Aenigmatarchaeota archaeon]
MILDSIKEDLPKDAMISDVSYEGSEIILYTKNKDFFNDSTDLIKKIVNKVKKRIEVRADQSIVMNEEKTIDLIKKLIPEEAVVKDIYFEPEFAKVVIHAEKPGLVIGKSGETLLSIKQKTFWTPQIYRAPVIDSELIKSIRKMLHKDAGYRKKFLNKIGEKIYAEGKEVEWIRLTGLGSFREVGRSCILLQTPQTRILLDCGMAVNLTATKPYPYLDVSEFNIQTLDAVLLSHAHMDHCLPPQTPVVLADGSRKPIKDVSEGDEVLSVDWKTGKISSGICSGKSKTRAHKKIYKIITSSNTIEASPNHRFFVFRENEIREVEAQELKTGELIPVLSQELGHGISTVAVKSGNYLLNMRIDGIVWQKITDIEMSENPYSELIDIEVLPHRNFVAEGIIVHNCGMVPYLYEYGYRGPLYCTRPTRDIAALMQLDYIQICQRENRKAFYSSKSIEETIRHCIPLEYGEVTDIAPDMRVTFQNAGHLLGSSSIHIHIGDGLYNLVYSLDWTVPTVLINPEGHVVIEPIGKIIDSAMDSEAVISDGFVERAANSKDWKAVSFNPLTLKAEIVPITSFMRHPINEKLYRIRASGGKETIVTASHNVFQVIDGEVKSVKTKDLRPGQFIVTARYVPVEEKEAIVDLTLYKHELRLQYSEEEIQQKIYENKDRARALFSEKHEKVLEWASEHYSGSFAYQIAKKHNIRTKTVRQALDRLGIPKHPRRLHLMPSKLKITPKLARFLGYFVAEGSSGRNEVRITNYDKKILNDCIDIIKTEFDIDGVIHKNDAIFCSRQLEFLLKVVMGCGDGAYSKRVPKTILNSTKEIVWEFLHGYYEGDGCFRVRPTGLCVSANSKSPELIREISLLLARFGIVPSLEFNASSEMYMAHVNSREHIETMLDKLGITKWEGKLNGKNTVKIRSGANERLPLSALSEQAQIRVQKSPYQNASTASLLMLPRIADLQEMDQKLMESCFAFAKILSIEEVESTSPYVYDLSIEGYENFLTGQGMIFVHNTGDIKYENTKLFEKAYTDYTRAEAIIIESTYGNSEGSKPSHKDGEASLVQHVRTALERGGRVLIPSFAVGRSQDVITILTETDINVPIYLDGMIWDTTAIHTAYPEYMSKYIQTLILHKGKNPFTDSRLHGIGSQKEREAALNSTEPAIIVSTSGMLMGGPAIEYLQAMAGNEKNMILFVGYQAEGSPGRRIQKGWKEVQLDNGKTLELKLDVQTVSGLGGHSDQPQLLAYLQHFKNKPRKIIVNHGDGTGAVEFARTIHKLFRVESVAPRNLETIRLR